MAWQDKLAEIQLLSDGGWRHDIFRSFPLRTVNNESQKVISRVLLMSGGMYDTTMTRDEYEKARYGQEDWTPIEIPGVFGEVLVTHAGALLGFIDRTSLDLEAALAAQQRVQQRSPLLS